METDALVIGSGPAGLQASIHAARRKVRVVVAGKLERSALVKAHVQNMFGVAGKSEGLALLEIGRKQAEHFGAAFNGNDVLSIGKTDSGFVATLEDGSEVTMKVIVFALGAKRKELKIAGADDFVGRGLSYCADCDAMFFTDKIVTVVGDESAAAASALMLRKYAKTTYLVSQKLRVPHSLAHELFTSGINLVEGRTVASIVGGKVVEGVKLDDDSIIKTDGVFVEMGAKGSLELGVQIDLIPDQSGYVTVDRKMATAVPGVFACGDVTGPPLQAVKAAGEGCVAGLSAVEYIETAPAERQAGTHVAGSDSWERD